MCIVPYQNVRTKYHTLISLHLKKFMKNYKCLLEHIMLYAYNAIYILFYSIMLCTLRKCNELYLFFI